MGYFDLFDFLFNEDEVEEDEVEEYEFNDLENQKILIVPVKKGDIKC